MSQHDFNIANQSFPATRTDINDAILAIVSNSSGDTEPSTTYANQWWYETDTNILKIRNEANNGWVDVITLDASMTASASELNQLDAITRGSILYGNASGETARLAAGAASTVLTSDGTDISWAAAAGGGGGMEFIASSGAISDGTASVSFTQFDATKYDHYQFHMQHIMPATDGASLFAHASTDGGSNYDTTNGNYHTNQVDRTGFHITDGLENTGGGESGVSGVFYLYAPHVTNKYTYGVSEAVQMVTVDYVSFMNEQTAHLAAQDTDALQFKFDSGNIESGEITMFGIVNS